MNLAFQIAAALLGVLFIVYVVLPSMLLAFFFVAKKVIDRQEKKMLSKMTKEEQARYKVSKKCKELSEAIRRQGK